METIQLLNNFLLSVKDNPKATAYHISVYVSLLHYGHIIGNADQFTVFSREVLPFAKLLRPGTYHRIMMELDEFGYIRYSPSHSAVLGSLVQLLPNQKDK